MKFYDNCGNTHKSMLGAIGANAANRLKGKKGGACKFDGAGRRADEQMDQITDPKQLNDEEMVEFVNSIIEKLNDPIEDYVSGKINSTMAEEVFFRTIFGTIAASIQTEYLSAKDIKIILLRFGNVLGETIVAKRKYHSEHNKANVPGVYPEG